MTQQPQDLRREIKKTKKHLNSLERKLLRMQKIRKKERITEDERISKLQRQVKRKYPSLDVDRELLTVVGTLPNFSVTKDNEIVRKVIAERYG